MRGQHGGYPVPLRDARGRSSVGEDGLTPPRPCHVHDRAPVIVPPEMFRDWLNPGTTDKSEVQRILDAIPEPVLTPTVVTDRVNSVRNNGPELIDPAT